MSNHTSDSPESGSGVVTEIKTLDETFHIKCAIETKGSKNRNDIPDPRDNANTWISETLGQKTSYIRSGRYSHVTTVSIMNPATGTERTYYSGKVFVCTTPFAAASARSLAIVSFSGVPVRLSGS